jgi:hypothetical protein
MVVIIEFVPSMVVKIECIEPKLNREAFIHSAIGTCVDEIDRQWAHHLQIKTVSKTKYHIVVHIQIL